MSQATQNEQTLLNVLQGTQKSCIGIFKPQRGVFQLVINNDDGFLTCLSIGNLFGLCTDHIMADKGTYVKFPDNKSLLGMMEDPFKWYEFYKQHLYDKI